MADGGDATGQQENATEQPCEARRRHQTPYAVVHTTGIIGPVGDSEERRTVNIRGSLAASDETIAEHLEEAGTPVVSSARESMPSTVTSPIEAMRLEELDRSRVFFRTALGLTIGGMIIAFTAAGDPIARTVVIAFSIASALGAAYILTFALDPARYDQRRIVLPGLPVLFGAIAGVYYWGIVSPVSGMLVFGIYFFSLGADSLITTVNYVVVSAAHALLGVGILTGLIADRGLVQMTSLRLQDRIALLVIVEFLYLVAFVTARLSQQATLRAVSKLEQAVRGVAHRDALLAEARAELDRVREIGGPGNSASSSLARTSSGRSSVAAEWARSTRRRTYPFVAARR